jgi:putative sterol carrier protein
MATVEQCREALHEVATRLGGDPAASAKLTLDRAIAVHITDLNHSFHGRLRGGQLVDITDGEDPSAQIRLSVTSDDLQAMVDGRLNIAAAWATGRASIKASFSDLLKLRKLM